MDKREYLAHWAKRYKDDLLGDIMPFWIKYGWDRKRGGVFTCLDRDGSRMDPTKSVWFQGRFAFTCAFAYNNVERRQEWLDAARGTLDFIERHCFDTDGRMFFTVSADGRPLRKRRYVFSETFAAIAMSEFALATGEEAYVHKAVRLFDETLRLLSTPGALPPKFEPEVRLRGHNVVMILVNVASRLRAALDLPRLTEQIDRSVASLRDNFMHPEFEALLETVGPGGEFIDTNMTRAINPGHCMETSWFIMEEARHRGWDRRLVDMALTIFNWSWKWGWDEQYGGIINMRDCRNLPPQDYSQDMKFWWPQCETIIASLYAYLATGEQVYLDRHRQVSEWAYARFPDAWHGEWFGYLHRDGTVAQPAKGNLFKGPFHIPRMMVKCHGLCNEILSKL